MKTVLCHGCFDVLHHGHLKYFEEAKKYGDRLVVSVTNDQFVNKGPGRPYFPGSKRVEMLKGIRIIDEVFLVDSKTAIPAIERVRPDFYVKGPDYRDFTKDVTGEIENEKKAVEQYGGKLVFTTSEMHSSSALINRFFAGWTDEQKMVIERIKEIGGVDIIEHALNQVSKSRILVIGEPIYDTYRFINPEGISSKSPTISARFKFEETYYGGAWAIQHHLSDFTDSCDLIHPYSNNEDIPEKIRYISQEKSQRVFEVTKIDENKVDQDRVIDFLKKHASLYDTFVICDFGHGLFEGKMLEALNELKGFVGLNVQTNSSNFGFNLFHKHRRFDYLCLDTREARLAIHDRSSPPLDIARSIHANTQRIFGYTQGSNGARVFFQDGEEYSPAFSDIVIDATGAGDAYFAITTALISRGVEMGLVPFIGNVFAGLKTKIQGNKSAVSKASLLKAIRGILA